MNRWSVVGITVLVLAAMPFYLAILATGWIWRRLVFNVNKVKFSYPFAFPMR